MIGRGLAVTALCAGMSGIAVAADCVLPSEERALNGRAIQSQAMVAAFTCNQRQRYNGFVNKFRNQLAVQGSELRHFFVRTYGDDASARLNRFVTTTANQASRRSLDDRQAYCAGASALFDHLDRIQPVDFPTFTGTVQPVANDLGFRTCVQRASATLSR